MTINKNLLIIEDSPPDLFLILHELRQRLPSVHITTSTTLKVHGEFDVIVTDLNLVGEAYGSEIVEELVTKYPTTPIIGFSGIGNSTVSEEYVKQGLTACYSKTEILKLVDTLEKTLGGSTDE